MMCGLHWEWRPQFTWDPFDGKWYVTDWIKVLCDGYNTVPTEAYPSEEGMKNLIEQHRPTRPPK